MPISFYGCQMYGSVKRSIIPRIQTCCQKLRILANLLWLRTNGMPHCDLNKPKDNKRLLQIKFQSELSQCIGVISTAVYLVKDIWVRQLQLIIYLTARQLT